MKNQVEEKVNLIFQVTKTGGTFKSGGTPKFEPLKNKLKFEPLKANETKFIPFNSLFVSFVLQTLQIIYYLYLLFN